MYGITDLCIFQLSQRFDTLRGYCSYFFTIHGSADDAAGISGAFATRVESADLRMLKSVVVAWDPYR